MTKSIITRKLIYYQLIGYGILLFLIAGDELFDFPHTVFGGQATPINWPEVRIEAGYVLVLCAFTVWLSWRLLTRIKYLEGFLSICQHCKKIRVGGEWKPLDAYISAHSAAEISHGLCPECMRKHYPEYAKDVK